MNWIFVIIALGAILFHFVSRLLSHGGEKLERCLPKGLGISGHRLVKVSLAVAMSGGIAFIISMVLMDRA